MSRVFLVLDLVFRLLYHCTWEVRMRTVDMNNTPRLGSSEGAVENIW